MQVVRRVLPSRARWHSPSRTPRTPINSLGGGAFLKTAALITVFGVAVSCARGSGPPGAADRSLESVIAEIEAGRATNLATFSSACSVVENWIQANW